MEILTDFPERLHAGQTVYIGSEHKPLRLVSLRGQDQALLVSFEGITDRDVVGALRNEIVYIDGKRLPRLPEGEYYHHQLVGLRVVDENDTFIGMLEEILETGANDVYVVRGDAGRETLIPAIEPVILAVDIDRDRPLPGLDGAGRRKRHRPPVPDLAAFPAG